jgi:phosphomannomutase
VRGTYATTLVSSPLLRAICAKRGLPPPRRSPGSVDQWAAPDLVYGYEEALGYCVAPDLVRDKDGITAALLVCELAAGLKAELGTSPTGSTSWRPSSACT